MVALAAGWLVGEIAVLSGLGIESLTVAGLLRNFSQGNNHNELATPNTTKKSLHPTWAMSIPPRSVPTAGPEAHPAENSAVVQPPCNPRKLRGESVLCEAAANRAAKPSRERTDST